jgi:hypothetical protein
VEAEARTQLANDPEPPDYLFDVPVGFANAVVPYRYDMAGPVYEELDPVTERRSLLSRLLGR